MFTTELVSLKNKILLPSRVGDTGFVCTCHRWESHSILTMFPSVCETNSGAYRHWIVLIPPAYSPVRDTYTAYSNTKVPWGRRSKKKFSETSVGDW